MYLVDVDVGNTGAGGGDCFFDGVPVAPDKSVWPRDYLCVCCICIFIPDTIPCNI